MKLDYHRPDLSIDQQLALRSSYDEFAGRAVVLNYLPLLAERFARRRLVALATVEGKHDSGVPVVLFLCTHNASSPSPGPVEPRCPR